MLLTPSSASYRPSPRVGEQGAILQREKHMGARSVEAVRRKLRALAATARDAGATQQERATAETLKARLKQRLSEAGVPAGDWTDNAFRLGRWAKEMREPAPLAVPTGDWTETAHRLGKAVRQGYKRWFSE
jgi:hypothetical protein